MYMKGWCCASWGVLVLTILLSLVASSFGRSVTSQHLQPAQTKRNAWWTKKSVGDSGLFDLGDSQNDWSSEPSKVAVEDYGEYEGLHPDVNDVPSKTTIGCYTSECVPALVSCARRRTAGAFNLCKQKHRACAELCFQK